VIQSLLKFPINLKKKKKNKEKFKESPRVLTGRNQQGELGSVSALLLQILIVLLQP
jgi:hypothetical protein